MKSYKDLIVWQRAMDVVTEVYGLTKVFPKEEIYTNYKHNYRLRLI